MACRDSDGTKCAGTWTVSATGAVALPESLCSLWQLVIRRSLGSPSLVALPAQALRGLPGLGSFPVAPHVRGLKGQSLLLTCWWGDVGRDRRWCWLHPLAWLSGIALLPWLPDFPPQAFPTTVSSLTSPWDVSPQSTADLTLGLLHNP